MYVPIAYLYEKPSEQQSERKPCDTPLAFVCYTFWPKTPTPTRVYFARNWATRVSYLSPLFHSYRENIPVFYFLI